MNVDLKLSLQRVIKKPKHVSNQRDAFNDGDLRKLFNSVQYTEGIHKQPSHFFILFWRSLLVPARMNCVSCIGVMSIKIRLQAYGL